MKQNELVAGLISGQLDWKNFANQNRSALGYDADMNNFLNYFGRSALGYDADFKNYDGPGGTQGMNQQQLRNWLNSQVASGSMTMSRLRVVYTPGVGVPAPVDIVLFNSTFADYTFDGAGNLVFTNAGGDTVTVHCMTTNGANGRLVTMQQLYKMTETQPFNIGFIRLKVKTTAQFDYSMGIIKDGQFGGYAGNSITPDDNVDPEQFQFLRVDVPMNTKASLQDGFSWTVDQDQTGSGIGMTLFITSTLNPNKQLEGKDPVRVLNGGVNETIYTPTIPTGQLQALAANPQVKEIMSSGMNKAMGQAMIGQLAQNITGLPMEKLIRG